MHSGHAWCHMYWMNHRRIAHLGSGVSADWWASIVYPLALFVIFLSGFVDLFVLVHWNLGRLLMIVSLDRFCPSCFALGIVWTWGYVTLLIVAWNPEVWVVLQKILADFTFQWYGGVSDLIIDSKNCCFGALSGFFKVDEAIAPLNTAYLTRVWWYHTVKTQISKIVALAKFMLPGPSMNSW